MPDDCLFCRMASGAAQVPKVHEDENVFVIKDIHPRAPVHVMIIPKEHIANARELGSGHGEILAHMFATATRVAEQLGVSEKGYRLTFNVGDEGGQTIYHLHLHLLGGRRLGPEG
jgi:histidine triad (HIT) family protein